MYNNSLVNFRNVHGSLLNYGLRVTVGHDGFRATVWKFHTPADNV